MKGEKIPDENHIARFCRPMQVHEEQIQATAFMLREGEPYLSVNWLEFLQRPSNLRQQRQDNGTYDRAGKFGLPTHHHIYDHIY